MFSIQKYLLQLHSSQRLFNFFWLAVRTMLLTSIGVLARALCSSSHFQLVVAINQITSYFGCLILGSTGARCVEQESIWSEIGCCHH